MRFQYVALLAHSLLGWAICGTTVGVGRQFFSMELTLIAHAAVAPLAFGLLTWQYFRRFPIASPATTALTMVGVVMGLDALVVAPFLEGSYAMFGSILGTWVPLALILVSSWITGRVASR